MNASYSLPVLLGLTITGVSAAYLLYLFLKKVRAVFTAHLGNDNLVERTVPLCLLVIKAHC